MNGYLDERVVSMKFDNKQFEQNAKTTLGTIDKLKSALNFKGAVQGLENVNGDVKDVNHSFEDTARVITEVSNKFTAMDAIAFSVLNRITNKVLDLGEKLVMSLSVDQLTSGWSKYESKITSVQTIMGATASTWEESAKAIGFAGTQMEYVSTLLDKLNWFSDETSYNFADMTNNIGKFTSSGIALDKAVEAMEGISVWAAKSGQNAQSASRAYYNLAQAISVGAVKLIDWKSIENANMATMEFKQTAIDTAVAMGTLKKVDDKTFKTLAGNEVTVRNFNEALKDEWFTADVLMSTLKEYGKATTKLSEISDKYGVTTTEFLGLLDQYNEGTLKEKDVNEKMGTSIKEIIPLFKLLNSEEYKLSLSAFRAAQEAKTFTEVIEATKDAVSTSWMNTFEIIFGNYEEAKKLWSEMAEQFYDIFNGGAEGRNSLLKKVMGDNWDRLIAKMNEAGISTEKFSKRLEEELKNSGVPIDDLIEKYGTLQEAIKHVEGIKDHIINVIKGFTEPIVEGAEAISLTTERLGEFQKVVNQVIRGEFKSGKTRVEKLTAAGWNYATVQGLVNKVWEKNGHTWKNTTITMEDLVAVMTKLNDKELESLGITEEQAEILRKLQEEADKTGTDINELIENITKPTGRQLLFNSLINLAEAFRKTLEGVRTAWDETFPNRDTVLYRLLEGFHAFTEWLVMDDETLEKFQRVMKGIFSLIGLFGDIIGEIVHFLFPGFAWGVDKLGLGVLDFAANIGDAIVNLREFVKEGNVVGQILGYLKDLFKLGADQLSKWFVSFRQLPLVNTIVNSLRNNFAGFFNFLKDLWDTFYNEMAYGSKNLVVAFEKVVNKIKDGIKRIYESYPYLAKIRDIFYKLFIMFKDAGKWVFEGLYSGIKNFDYKKLWTAVVNVAKGMVDVFCDYMGIHSPATRWIQLAIECLRGIIVGVVEWTNKVVLAIKDFVVKMYKAIEVYITDPNFSPFEKIKEVTQKTLEKISTIFVGFFSNIGKSLKAIAKFIVDNRILQRAYYALKSFLTLALLFNTVRITSRLPKVLSSFADSFSIISKSVKKYMSSLTAKNYAKIAKDLALAIAIIALSIYSIAKLPEDQAKTALQALTLFQALVLDLGLALSMLIAVTNASSKFAAVKEVNKSIVAQFAALILSITAFIWIFVDALGKLVATIGNPDIDGMTLIVKGLAVLAGMVIAISASCWFIAKKCAKGSRAIAAAGIGMFGISLAIYVLLQALSDFFINAKSVKYIDFSDAEILIRMFEGLLIIGLLLTTITAVTRILNKTVIAATIKSAISMSVLLLGLSFSVKLLLDAISKFVNGMVDALDKAIIVIGGNDPTKGMDYIAGILYMTGLGLLALIGIVTVFLAVVGHAIKGTTIKQMWGVSSLLLTFSAALWTLVMVINDLFNLVSDAVKTPVGALSLVITLGVILVAVAGLIKLVNSIGKNNVYSAAVTIVAMTAFLGVLTYAIYKLYNLPDATKTIILLSVMTVAILAVLEMINILNNVQKYKWQTGLGNALQLLAISSVFLAIGHSVEKLKDVDWRQALAVITMIGLAVAGLMWATNLLSTNVMAIPNAAVLLSISVLLLSMGNALSSILDSLQGDKGAGKLQQVVVCIAELCIVISAFVGVLALITHLAPGVILSILAIGVAFSMPILSIAALIGAIAALLAAIGYFEENGGLVGFFQDVANAIQTVIDGIIDLINWFKNLSKVSEDALEIIPGVLYVDFDKSIFKNVRTNQGVREALNIGNTNQKTFDREDAIAKALRAQGISESTLSQMISDYGSLFEAMKHIEEIKSSGKYSRYQSSTGTVAAKYYGSSGFSTQATKDIQKATTDALTSSKVKKYYYDYTGKSQENQSSVVDVADLSKLMDTSELNKQLSSFNMEDYASTMQTQINESMSKALSDIPLGDTISKYINMEDYLGNMDLNIDLDTSELMSSLNIDSMMSGLDMDFGNYTDLLGEYTGQIGTYTKTLAEIKEDFNEEYGDYSLRGGVMGMVDPETVVKKKGWGNKRFNQEKQNIAKQYGYSTWDEYVADYYKYLHYLQAEMHPDEIKFDKKATKEAYVESYVKYLGYLDALDEVFAAEVREIASDYLYMNPDKRYVTTDALADYLSKYLNKSDLEASKEAYAQGLASFIDVLIDQFYADAEKNLMDYYGLEYTSNTSELSKDERLVVNRNSSGVTGYAWGRNTQATIDVPRLTAPDKNGQVSTSSPDVVSELRSTNQKLDELSAKILHMQVVMDTGALVGNIQGAMSRVFAGNTKNKERGM